jgi:hypothetical protein
MAAVTAIAPMTRTSKHGTWRKCGVAKSTGLKTRHYKGRSVTGFLTGLEPVFVKLTNGGAKAPTP